MVDLSAGSVDGWMHVRVGSSLHHFLLKLFIAPNHLTLGAVAVAADLFDVEIVLGAVAVRLFCEAPALAVCVSVTVDGAGRSSTIRAVYCHESVSGVSHIYIMGRYPLKAVVSLFHAFWPAKIRPGAAYPP